MHPSSPANLLCFSAAPAAQPQTAFGCRRRWNLQAQVPLFLQHHLLEQAGGLSRGAQGAASYPKPVNPLGSSACSGGRPACKGGGHIQGFVATNLLLLPTLASIFKGRLRVLPLGPPCLGWSLYPKPHMYHPFQPLRRGHGPLLSTVPWGFFPLVLFLLLLQLMSLLFFVASSCVSLGLCWLVPEPVLCAIRQLHVCGNACCRSGVGWSPWLFYSQLCEKNKPHVTACRSVLLFLSQHSTQTVL